MSAINPSPYKPATAGIEAHGGRQRLLWLRPVCRYSVEWGPNLYTFAILWIQFHASGRRLPLFVITFLGMNLAYLSSASLFLFVKTQRLSNNREPRPWFPVCKKLVGAFHRDGASVVISCISWTRADLSSYSPAIPGFSRTLTQTHSLLIARLYSQTPNRIKHAHRYKPSLPRYCTNYYELNWSSPSEKLPFHIIITYNYPHKKHSYSFPANCTRETDESRSVQRLLSQ